MATINQNSRRTRVAKLCSLIAVKLIALYQIIISPVLHALSLSTVGGGCRFYPTCSEYSVQAIKYYGFNFKSIGMILSRIYRCRPIFLSKNKSNNRYSGYDPVVSDSSEFT